MNPAALTFRFRMVMFFFIAGLVLSGVTAFPLLLELRTLAALLGAGNSHDPTGRGDLVGWIVAVRNGLEDTYTHYPWIAYGTDWLAFGHIVIAMFFVGAFLQPESARATLYTGIVACVAVIPLALICGPIRGIPPSWRLVDCSFGIFGIIPLLYCLALLRRMEAAAQRGRGIRG